MTENKKSLIEAALFISHEPVKIEELRRISDMDKKEILEIVEEIEEIFSEGEFGFELFESPEGYELRVKPQYLERVSHLTPYSDLKRGQLKVLALVAFKQPIKQSDIVDIIGNRAYNYIKKLEGRDLIRSEKFKRTKVLKTTKSFMDYFGIEEREELVEKLEEAFGDRKDQVLKKLEIPELDDEKTEEQ
ncbi:MAG: SMC-Scp complex subunit ScpB [Candidatus Aenigmatarchaeota archaeon]